MAPDSLLISLADYERAAEGMLDPGALGYFAGGAGDEITLADNAAAWQRIALRPRALVGVGTRDPSVTVLGRRRPNPLIVAPMAFQRLGHPDGELATARAAAAAGAVFCLSTLGTTSVPALAQDVPEASRWFQLYVLSDRGVTRELISQASDHGYEALVVTVDLPVLGVRERELRHEATADPADVIVHALAATGSATSPAEFTALVDPDLNWRDIEQIASESPLPVIVKGLLTREDAVLAAEHGAAGVVVSNHGGRQLDTVLASADALPEIVDAVGDRLDVLVDGGIRRGTDVLKALALGARAALVGRPLLWGLTVDGAAGAEHVLRILLAELDVALGLSGAPRASELDRAFVTSGPWTGPPR
jgi:4-hydroxymandelate oxidase